MEAYTLAWYMDEKKPRVIKVKVHAKREGNYIIEHLELKTTEKCTTCHESVLWFDYEEAKKVADSKRY